MPRRPRRKKRRRTGSGYPANMISRYMRSPYDPDNSRNFWGYVLARTIANPPRSGAGRWFAWLLTASMIGTAGVAMIFGTIGDGVSLVLVIVLGIVGVVLLLRLLSQP